MSRFLILAAFALSAPGLWASPGAVDQYNCHRDPNTNQRHCHGTQEQAQQYHILIGAMSTNDLWLYDDGPYNLFSGVGGQIEVGFSSIALFGAYHYQWHATDSSDFYLRGWDLGIKAGPNIARLGLHPYVTAGYYSLTFEIPGKLLPLGGYEAGAGLIYNRAGSSIELRAVYRNPDDLKETWAMFGYEGVVASLHAQLGYHLRF